MGIDEPTTIVQQNFGHFDVAPSTAQEKFLHASYVILQTALEFRSQYPPSHGTKHFLGVNQGLRRSVVLYEAYPPTRYTLTRSTSDCDRTTLLSQTRLLNSGKIKHGTSFGDTAVFLR